MTVNSNKDGNSIEFVLSGRLDSTTSEDLENYINKEITDTTGSVTVDLSDVDFISSKGLRVLVGTYKKLKNGEMTLKGANESIREVIRLSGLLKIFKMI